MQDPSDVLNGFSGFVKSVSAGPRHCLNAHQQKFLNRLGDRFCTRVKVVPSRTVVYRCQKAIEAEDQNYQIEHSHGDTKVTLNGVQRVIQPVAESRMRPLAGRALEGRANPKGIPVFYCAESKVTAVSETRPLVEEDVTVAEFQANRELRVISFSMDDLQLWDATRVIIPQTGSSGHSKDDLYAAALDLQWYEIGKAFSKPIDRMDDVAGYAPTQIISEFVRSKGYDGIAYESRLCGTRGVNYALYDGNCVDFLRSYVMTVRSIRVDIELYR